MFLSCLHAEICEKVYFTSIMAAILDFFKILLLHMYEKKWNPIFFLSRSYSEPESVAKSILTNKNYKWTCTNWQKTAVSIVAIIGNMNRCRMFENHTPNNAFSTILAKNAFLRNGKSFPDPLFSIPSPSFPRVW